MDHHYLRRPDSLATKAAWAHAPLVTCLATPLRQPLMDPQEPFLDPLWLEPDLGRPHHWITTLVPEDLHDQLMASLTE